jgi:BirA family biotin operon repressor/biotin-[acetyl-CoA-carboxylase] ligase
MGSVILRPPAPWPVYYWTVMAGLAAALAAREFGVDARIKWPNDVMIGDRKLAGVLVEMAGDAAVVGVGINCTLTEADLPLELHGRTASLHQHIEGPPDREAVLAALRLNLMALHQTLAEGSVNPMVIGWNAHNWLRRRPVRVTGPTGIVEGEGLFLNGVRWTLDVFRDGGVVAMPLSSSVAAR